MADPITVYATELDLEHYGLGERRLDSLEAAPDLVEAALEGASRVADDYLGSQYTLPLTAIGTSLRMHVSWIAAYVLMKSIGYNPEQGAVDPFKTAYDDAIRWLVRVQNGLSPEGVIGSDAPGAPGTGGQSPSARPRIISGSSRGFSSRGSRPASSTTSVGAAAASWGTDMAGVTGDFRALAQLANAFEGATSPRFQAGLSQALAVTAMKQLADEFRSERDPYGRPWAPLKLRTGKILSATGRLRNSATVYLQPAGGFGISLTAAYAATHQYGATIRPRAAKMLTWQVRGGGKRYFAKKVVIPKRQMIPEESTGGYGPIWTAAMNKAGVAYVTRWFQEGGTR